MLKADRRYFMILMQPHLSNANERKSLIDKFEPRITQMCRAAELHAYSKGQTELVQAQTQHQQQVVTLTTGVNDAARQLRDQDRIIDRLKEDKIRLQELVTNNSKEKKEEPDMPVMSTRKTMIKRLRNLRKHADRVATMLENASPLNVSGRQLKVLNETLRMMDLRNEYELGDQLRIAFMVELDGLRTKDALRYALKQELIDQQQFDRAKELAK